MGPAAYLYESQYLRGRCWCKGKWFICRLSGRWETHITKPMSWKMGNLCHKVHLRLSVEVEVFCVFFFYKDGEGNITKRSRLGGVAKFSMCRWAQSIPIRQMMVWCVSCWFGHLGFISSRLHGWMSANLLEVGCLKVKVCIFWSEFLGLLYKHAVYL